MKTYIRSIFAVLLCVLLYPVTASAQMAVAESVAEILPPEINNLPVQDGERFITLKGDYTFILNSWGAVQIVDTRQIDEPRRIAQIQTGVQAKHIRVAGDRLFIANSSEGVAVYNIANMEQPHKIADISTPGLAVWTAVKDNYLIVALGKDGFCVMDISDLGNPRVATLELPEGWVWSVEIYDSQLFVGAKSGGFYLYNIENPAAPQKISSFSSGYQSLQANVENGIAYIADGPGGLLIVDISNPELPEKLAQFPTGGFAHQVHKSGTYAYVADRDMGLAIINVADPAHPKLIGQYVPESEAYSVVKKDVFVFLVTDQKTEIKRHNNQPILSDITDQTLRENELFRLQLQASDPDGDPIIFSAENLPEGSTFNDTTGLFTWLPTFEQSGTYSDLIFKVTEITGSRLSDADTINLVVEHVNRLPDLPPLSNLVVPEDSAFTIQAGEATDPDAEDQGKITYRVENLPEGAEFDPQTRIFKWKPTFEQSGEYILDFIADDGAGGIDREAVTITVTHVDRPPVLTPIADQTINEGEPFSLTIQGEEPDKEDLDKISYTALNLPEGAEFDPNGPILSWTPTYDQSGEYGPITIIMQAGALSDTVSFRVTVQHVNRPPVVEAISDQITDENQELRVPIVVSDPDVEDTGKLQVVVENLPEGAIFNPDSLLISWKPTFEQSGDYPGVSVTATDPSGLSDNKVFGITVHHVNRPPVLESVPAITGKENEEIRYQLVGSDPDAEDAGKLVYSADNLPEGAALEAATGLFTWTPTFEQSGSYQLTFRVSDGFLSAEQTAVITVEHVNRPPVLQPLAPLQAREGEPVTLTLQGSDPDKEDTGKLVFTALNLPEGAGFDPATRTFSWTPGFDQSGEYNTIQFTVADPAGLTATQVLTLTVEHVNRPPVIEAIGPFTVNENEPLAFSLKGSDPDKEDAGKLRFALSPLPTGAQLDPISGAFNWTPDYTQAGEYQLTATITDEAGLQAEVPIQITVNQVNRPPKVNMLPPATVAEGEELTLKLPVEDPDAEDAGKLAVTITSALPKGAAFNAADFTLTWKPDFDQAGDYSLEFTVSDPAGEKVNGSVALRVSNTNRPPQISGASDVTVKEGEKVEFSIQTSDPDAEDAGALQLSAEGLPEGAVFDPASGAFKWVPGQEQSGSYAITFKVKDPGGLESSQKITVTVEDVPVLPPPPPPQN